HPVRLAPRHARGELAQHDERDREPEDDGGRRPEPRLEPELVHGQPPAGRGSSTSGSMRQTGSTRGFVSTLPASATSTRSATLSATAWETKMPGPAAPPCSRNARLTASPHRS